MLLFVLFLYVLVLLAIMFVLVVIMLFACSICYFLFVYVLLFGLCMQYHLLGFATRLQEWEGLFRVVTSLDLSDRYKLHLLRV